MQVSLQLVIAYLVFAFVFVVFALYKIRSQTTQTDEVHHVLLEPPGQVTIVLRKPPLTTFQNHCVDFGTLIEDNTRSCFVLPVIAVSLLLAGLSSCQVEDDPMKLWVPQKSKADDDHNEFVHTYDVPRAETLVFVMKDETNSSVLTLDALKELYTVEQMIRNFTYEYEFEGKVHQVRLRDVCIRAFNDSDCMVQSVTEYFTNLHQIPIPKLTQDTMNTILTDCFSNPRNPHCVGHSKLAIPPSLIIGGYNLNHYFNATCYVTTISLHNGQDLRSRSMNWEVGLIELLENHNRHHKENLLKVMYSTERSVVDEVLHIENETFTGVLFACYFVAAVFLSVCLSTPWLGFFSVVLVVLSGIASVAIVSLAGLKVNILVFQGLPLVLLVFAFDNAILLGLEYRRVRFDQRTAAPRLALTFVETCRSITISTLSQAMFFLFGCVGFFPAVEVFCVTASISLTLSYLLHMTTFSAALVLTSSQSPAAFLSSFVQPEDFPNPEGWFLCRMFLTTLGCFGRARKVYVAAIRIMFLPFVRILVVLASVGLCFYFAAFFVVNELSGLAVEDVIPDTSYFYEFQVKAVPLLRVGPQLDISIRGLNFSAVDQQNLLCGYDHQCLANSAVNYIQHLDKDDWDISEFPGNWLDDYLAFLDPLNPCCLVHNRTAANPVLCSDRDTTCEPCLVNTTRPTSAEFYQFLDVFLDHNHCRTGCPICGAAHERNLKLERDENGRVVDVTSSRFQLFHSQLKHANDYVEAVDASYVISSHILNTIENFFRTRYDGGRVHCAPHSSFYVFTDAYLFMKAMMQKAFVVAALIVFLTNVILFHNLTSMMLIYAVVAVVVTEMFGFFAATGILLNALTLANGLAATGLSLGLFMHVENAFENVLGTRIQRAVHAILRTGPSILALLLLKLVGIMGMYFFPQRMYYTYFFAIFMMTLLLSSLYSVVLLPVLLSFVGRKHIEL